MEGERNVGSKHRSTPKALQRDVTSPKRTASERQGLHAWLPYYAGFSEGFVADILGELHLRSQHVVLDPMNGSGTTTMVSQKCGYMCVGTEINPAMAVIARAKDPALLNVEQTNDLAGSLSRAAARRRRAIPFDEHTASWIPPRAFANLKRLDAEIQEHEESPILPLDSRLAKIVPAAHSQTGGRVKDLLRAALLITARRASSTEQSKNPTWLKPGNGGSVAEIDVFEEFRETAAAMFEDLASVFKRIPKRRRGVVFEADAKGLPLPQNSIDAIVTSPPYLTRIDYAVGTAPELVLLGFESKQDLRSLRTQIMGSTCVTGGPYGVRPCWGKTCLRTIDQVRRHHSKASSGYYLKTHVQYFRDAEAIIRECLRVLKPNAPAVFVVQDSWYKDIHVALAKIYVEMALQLGATSAETIHSEAVRNHLGLVNTRARRYHKGQIREHVVLFRSR